MKYTQEELNTIIENHKHWLNKDCDGWVKMKANLSRADLSRADLSRADLRGADLRGADLSRADLSRADLRGANLRGADLSRADLSRAADLSCANLRDANLSGSNLRDANLSGANICDANLSGAKELNSVIYDEHTSFFALQCPESGPFEAWKQAFNCKEVVIVHLLVPSTAKRSSATSRKCRVSEAQVLDIKSLGGIEEYNEAISKYDCDFVYRVGDTVKVDNFDDNRWNECAPGIHCFITRQEAVNFF